MQTRRKIHTQLKVLASLNSLPTNYQKQIHSSQLKRYRETKPSDYFGHELHDILNQEIKWIKQFGDFPTAKNISISILKLFVFFRSVIQNCKGFKTALRKNKFFFAELSQRFRQFIPTRSYSKLIGIGESTLYHWIREVRVRCTDSLINVCRKVHPNQLLIPEVQKMKKLLSDENFKFWPLRSLHYFALRNKIVSMRIEMECAG